MHGDRVAVGEMIGRQVVAGEGLAAAVIPPCDEGVLVDEHGVDGAAFAGDQVAVRARR